LYPKILNNIINVLAKLPGVGKVSAERMATHLFSSFSNEELVDFGNNLLELKTKVKYCQHCNNLTQDELCDVCSNPLRDQETIMVVREPKDLYIIEQTNKYQGLYHVLGGLIDLSRGKTWKDIKVDNLLSKIKENKNHNLKEIIIALDTTIEGEITSAYLKKVIEEINPELRISRISYGIPLNIDLKYVDANTLLMSIEKRIKY
jgi:recombination protein RecR